MAGALPLGDLATNNRTALYLCGEIDVTEPGEVEIHFNDDQAVANWIDDRPLAASGARTATVDRGRHRITLRIDMARRDNKELRVTVDKPAGSSAVYTVVGGP